MPMPDPSIHAGRFDLAHISEKRYLDPARGHSNTLYIAQNPSLTFKHNARYQQKCNALHPIQTKENSKVW
jgi:hypothetical protein